VYGPSTGARDPDVPSYRMYVPDQALNRGYVNDPTLTALLKEQRRTKDLEARKQLIDAFQRYVAEQQYYVYTISAMMTGSWQAVCEELCPEPDFRLRQSCCRPVAGTLGARAARRLEAVRCSAAPHSALGARRKPETLGLGESP
jgi:hypothetical protein